MAPRLSLIAAMLAFACSSAPRFQCPEHGGAEWHEYRSEHFTVATDGPDGKAAALLRWMERLRASDLLALVGEQVEIPGRLRVLAFAKITDFEDFAGGAGGYYRLDAWGRPSAVVPIDVMRLDPEALPHELAHYISHYLFPVQRMWFAEGLAGFVQTIALGTDELAGAMPTNYGSFFSYDHKLSARDLLAWKGTEDSWTGGRYHAWSWLLYRYLWNDRGADFTSYQKRLMDGDDPDAAWTATFPEFDPARDDAIARLDSELYTYRTHLRSGGYQVRARVPKVEITKWRLPPAEVHLLLVALRRQWAKDESTSRAFVRAQIEEALREDPRNAGAMVALVRLDGKMTAEAARKIAAAAPEDWRAWRTVGASDDAPAAEREAADRKAIELNPEDPTALNNLAWILATTDRSREALPFANRALDLAPWNPAFIDTLAEIAVRMGKCPEAVRLIHRAAKIDELKRGERGSERVAEIQSRCATQGASR